MKINLFFSSSDISPFELGGVEFLGKEGGFYKVDYRSQDLQMVFISLAAFSFSIRSKKYKYIMSSKITLSYKKKTNCFFVNNILIERLSYFDLIKCLHETVEDAIKLLRAFNNTEPVLMDLHQEEISLKKILNNN
ncbi:hypothetical protein RJ498_003779 [Pluralibacter gergoviae]